MYKELKNVTEVFYIEKVIDWDKRIENYSDQAK